MIEPDDLWWNAVKDRDATFDGALFYGVVTTGIYCRPGCPSRRPKPENVRFFADTASARRAGLRACKRCRPDAAVAGNVATRLVVGACDRLSSQDPLPSAGRVCDAFGLQRPYAAARLQGRTRRHAGTVFAGVEGAAVAQRIAQWRSDHRCPLQRRLRIIGSRVRKHRAPRYAAVELCGGRRGRPHRVRDAENCSRLVAGGGVAEWLVLRTLRRVARCAGFHADRRISDSDAWSKPLTSGLRRYSTSPTAWRIGASCRSMCAAPLFRKRCGKRCVRSRRDKHEPTRRSHKRSGCRTRCAPSPMRAQRTRSPSRCRAIVCCRRRAVSAAIGGVREPNASCSNAKARAVTELA